ncbi:hypothetical protein [Streptomyces smyrnaeus]|uniref:hypothetical protein n=1 Tax=Streptomyces smyrnaeus TaxID=1387713 RepID=UPI0036C5A9F5
MRTPNLARTAAAATALVAAGALGFTVPSASADTGSMTLTEAKAHAEARSGSMDC